MLRPRVRAIERVSSVNSALARLHTILSARHLIWTLAMHPDGRTKRCDFGNRPTRPRSIGRSSASPYITFSFPRLHPPSECAPPQESLGPLRRAPQGGYRGAVRWEEESIARLHARISPAVDTSPPGKAFAGRPGTPTHE